MKEQFYLKHSLVTMCDSRMRNLLAKEGLKGIGAYWVILEKLELLPEPCAQLEYLRPFCKSLGISFAYIKKIILEYQLFSMDEEGYFMPEELNPIHNEEEKAVNYAPINVDFKLKNEKKHRKTAKKTAKTVEKRQKIAEKSAKNAQEIQVKKHDKCLINAFLNPNKKHNNKENIKDIIITTTTEKKEKEKEKEKTTAAAVAVLLKSKTCGQRKPFGMTHVTVPNDAAQLPKPRSSTSMSCVVWVT